MISNTQVAKDSRSLDLGRLLILLRLLRLLLVVDLLLETDIDASYHISLFYQ
ncbi:hypothetical protein M0N77_08810 [Psychrobacter sp. AH5]|uniref:hypothetical protein n=1 Tax=Psychrobacter sp. AH5 TaxID=2937433 RepID=UPI003342AEDD